MTIISFRSFRWLRQISEFDLGAFSFLLSFLPRVSKFLFSLLQMMVQGCTPPQPFPICFMSFLVTYLKLSSGQHLARLPLLSSRYSTAFSILLPSIRRNCPSQRSRRCLKRVYMLGRPALESFSELVTRFCQDITSILIGLLKLKTFRRFSCLEIVVQVSLL